jgi:hypothetical protein
MRDIEQEDLSKVRPRDYLRKGFFDSKGRLREHINGQDSLAMAYHARSEKLTVHQLELIVGRLQKIADQHSVEMANPQIELSSEVRTAILQVAGSEPVRKSPAIFELMQLSTSMLKKWKDFAALLLHMQRILAQLALIHTLTQAEPTPAGAGA